MALTGKDWCKIHAKAYKDQAFRTQLETDPTAAIRTWHAQEYKKEQKSLDKIVDLTSWLNATAADEGGDKCPPPGCC